MEKSIRLRLHRQVITMPAFRNVAPNRHSGRLGKHTPVIYDKDGWQVPDNDVKVDLLNDDAPLPSPLLDAVPRSLKQEEPLLSSLLEPSPDVDAASSVPARRNSHTRRREPGHIPRPRNAFIFFRSSYISSAIASGEGQQNELSKHAGKVWNKMSAEERRPFCELAAIEKQEHYARHPDYVYSPGRSGSKGKSKTTSARKTGGVNSATGRKRKAFTDIEDSWSRSSDTCSEPPSPDSPLIPAARPAKLQRAAARRAVQRFVESPTPAPSARLTPISDKDEGEFEYPAESSSGDDTLDIDTPLSYVPTSDIPELEFTPMTTKEEKPLEVTREPPSPFHPHLDPVTGDYAYREYNHDFMSSFMPTLPHISLSPTREDSLDDTVDMPFIPIPTTTLQSYCYSTEASFLSPSNPMSNADYSGPSISSHSFNDELEDDSVMKRYTDMMDMNTGSNEYFEMEQDPDASIFQFFNFD